MSWHIEYAATDKREAREILNSKVDSIPISVLEHIRDLIDSLSDQDAPRCLLHVKSFGHIGGGPAGTDTHANMTAEVRWVPRYC